MAERPIEKCYWVVPGKLLAGEHPQNSDSIKKIEDAGIVSFIDLTEEDKHAPYDRWLEVAEYRRFPIAEYRRFPIEDYDIPKSNEHTIAILNLIDDNLRGCFRSLGIILN